jgi:hypothetical protein
MRYLYVCPKCKTVYHDVVFSALDSCECPTCKANLLCLGVDKDQWNRMSQEEKTELQERISNESNDPLLTYLKNINTNIITIKRILIFFCVLVVIYLIILLLQSLIV